MKPKIQSSFALGSFVCIFLFTSCTTNKQTNAELELFPVASPLLTDTAYFTEYVADIHSIQNIELRAKVDGYLEAIHVDEGERVTKGQLLFSINSQAFRQELSKAQATLTSTLAEAKAAEVELKSATVLAEKSVISQTQVELAQAKYEALLAKIEEARAQQANATLELSYTQIRAPFNGIINRIPNRAGSLVETGTLLTTISNNTEVFAYFNLSEKDYLDYMATASTQPTAITLLLANGATYPHQGKIETIESEFDQSTGNIAFRARFPNPDQILKHGGSGKVQLRKEIKAATLIPQKSTFEIQGNIYVFVVNADGIVELRQVKPTFSLPHVYVIGAGLQPNEQFVYEGIQRLKAGDKIERSTTSPATVSQLMN
jgi:RND family efflux transporter MFP subunit